MTERKREYLRYLESEHWKTLRLQTFERDGHKCVRCGDTKRLEGHHKRYRGDLRSYTIDDIETVCKPCHEVHHKQEKYRRKLALEKRLPRRENIPFVSERIDPVITNGIETRNADQASLASQSWFTCALMLDRKHFKREVKRTLRTRGILKDARRKLLSNAIVLWARNRKQKYESAA